MAGKIIHGMETTETAGLATLIVLWISAGMDWLNENHLAVIALVAIVTGIVTILAAIFKHKLNERIKIRMVELREKEVAHKIRRKEDK